MESEEGSPFLIFFLYKQIIPTITNKINSTSNKISFEFIPHPLLFPVYATCAQYGTLSKSDTNWLKFLYPALTGSRQNEVKPNETARKCPIRSTNNPLGHFTQRIKVSLYQ